MPNKKTPKVYKGISNKEIDEQALLIEYLEIKGLKFSALPLDTFTKSWSVKNRNKKLGVRPGVPDLMVIIKGKLVFIEMKREKGGRLSPYQKEWIEELNKCEDVYAVCCNGFDEAKKVVNEFLRIVISHKRRTDG